MPITLEDGSEKPTPEETVGALLEQGDTPDEIIAEAEANIAHAQAGIDWVIAIAAEEASNVDDSVRALMVAKRAVDQAMRAGADAELIKEARKLLEDSAFTNEVASLNSGDAKDAAAQHRVHAEETIANARARVAAANDSKITGPAIQRYKDLKKAEAAALKSGAS